MEQIDYHYRLHEALSKAFAARDESARTAYLDLASFYHRKLGGKPQMQPTADILGRLRRSKRERI